VGVQLVPNNKGEILALIVTETLDFPAGHNFLTQSTSELQCAVFKHPKGHSIQRHWHPSFPRELTETCEVLVIQAGSVEASIYDDDLKLVHCQVLNSGDVVVLLSGGHGFEVLEASVIVEVKQGPYAGISDKEVF
jgi:hypothetical protein